MSVSIVSIIFKLLNFSLLLGLGYVIFRSYFATSIKAKIEEKINSLQELEHKQLIIKQQKNSIEQAIQHQEQEGERLLVLLKIWHSTVQRVQEKEEQRKQAQELKNADRNSLQEHHEQIRRLELDIIPQVVQSTRAKFIEEFQNDQQGAEFLDALIERIQKSHI